ncbi:uncharacterized protein LOC119359090 [Triticum dicoccoides]|uniref:uncharacterized protein LOC119359090 n=1 Tax=Triticum dicoccoides TaxID=85692 RepID=UPI00188FE0E5|nr:uncharacterized protein LOC119359090 [Triticum dicoccoides]XP_044455628.1 uncharacterized protein LOC123187766 [Triticum aestivum]
MVAARPDGGRRSRRQQARRRRRRLLYCELDDGGGVLLADAMIDFFVKLLELPAMHAKRQELAAQFFLYCQDGRNWSSGSSSHRQKHKQGSSGWQHEQARRGRAATCSRRSSRLRMSLSSRPAWSSWSRRSRPRRAQVLCGAGAGPGRREG